MRLRTLALSLITAILPTSPLHAQEADWYDLHLQYIKEDKEKALESLQIRYTAQQSNAEKLFISGLIYNLMSDSHQPYFGSSFDNSEFSNLENRYIAALTDHRAGRYDQAIDKLESLFSTLKNSGDTEGHALIEYQLCITLNNQGEYHQSNYYCSSLKNHVERNEVVTPTYLAYRVIANNYDFRGDYTKALNFYQKVLEEAPESYDLTGIYNDVGLLLVGLAQFAKAEEYLLLSLDQRLKTHDTRYQAQSHHSLAYLYKSRLDYSSALNHYQQSLRLLEDSPHAYGLTLTHIGLGDTYMLLEQYELAHSHLRQALELAKAQNSDSLIASIHLNLSETFQQQGYIDKALSHIAMSKDHLSVEQYEASYLQLSELYQVRGNYKEALKNYQNYSDAILTRLNKDNIRAMEALELVKTQYEHDIEMSQINYDANLKRLQIEKLEHQSQIYNLVITLLLLTLGASIYLARRNQTRAEQDNLTGVINRGAAIAKIRAMPTEKRPDHKYVLALIDLDNFKSINDEYGHPTGDQVLKRVCEVISSKLDDKDFIGRLGGEEFVILLREVDEIDVPFKVRSIHKAISDNPISSETGEVLKVTASMSFIATSRALYDFDELYSILDQALFQVKRTGRNAIIDAYNEPIDLPQTASEPKNA